MSNKGDAGQAGNIQFSNLVWQFKLQAERQLGAKDSLRDLMGDPRRLEELLSEAEQRGDAALRKLASDVRAQQHASRIIAVQPKRRVPMGLLVAGLVLCVIGLATVLLLGRRNNAGAPAPQAATAATPVAMLFRMHGSNTIGEKLGPALAEGYLKLKGASATEVKELGADERQVVGQQPGAAASPAIEVFAHGSATAFKDLAAQATDLGMASRRIKPEEVAQLSALDGDLSSPSSEHVLGLDGVALIVNPANPLQSLTIEQVGKLFAGTITDWSAVGGRAGPVNIHARDDKSGTYDTFKSLVLDPLSLKLLAGAHRYESSTELSDAVAADPGGIGFIGLPYVRRSKLIGISASAGNPPIVPTQFTVGTEDYPLARRLYLYLPGKNPSKDAADFVEYALSDAGQDVVKQIGFVSQNPYTEKVADNSNWPADYRQMVAGAERLSFDFRFESGTGNP
ncbi:MAG: phosphate ABC transporter substrate-binding protein, partial [Nevskia sp.]|nr:phosphate ABC transporter substrate-binding protein [Nevskia sp.]